MSLVECPSSLVPKIRVTKRKFFLIVEKIGIQFLGKEKDQVYGEVSRENLLIFSQFHSRMMVGRKIEERKQALRLNSVATCVCTYLLTYLLTYVELANPQSENTTRRLVFRKHRFALLAAWETRAHSHPRARIRPLFSPLFHLLRDGRERKGYQLYRSLLCEFLERDERSSTKIEMKIGRRTWIGIGID